MWQPALWGALGGIGTGILAVLTGLPKKAVESWVDHRFKLKQDELNRAHQEKLVELNHEYQAKLEKFRSEIQQTFSRISKVHEQEYKILPQAWLYLHTAYGSAYRAVLGFTSAIRFDTMTDSELNEFLATLTTFSETQKNRIRNAPDAAQRRSFYFEGARVKAVDQMEESQRVFRNYLIKKSLFMSKGVYEAFDAVSLKLIDANTHFTSGDALMKNEAGRKLIDLKAEVDALFVVIQKRLYVSEA
jgi:hypothetical protein